MSLRTLQLEELHLMLGSEELELGLSSTVDIRFSSRWDPSLGSNDILKALTSGNVWVSRGRRCRIEIQILFDGKPIHEPSRIAALESLGYHIRGSHLWAQLSLSASLEIPNSEESIGLQSNFSVYINHCISSHMSQLGRWVPDNLDIKAPESVLCAEFECLHAQLNFRHDLQRPLAVKRAKSFPPSSSLDMMLLDQSSGLEGECHLNLLEKTVNSLSENLPKLIANCFQSLNKFGPENFSQPHAEKLSLDDKTLSSVPPAEADDLIHWTGLTRAQLAEWMYREGKGPEDFPKCEDEDIQQLPQTSATHLYQSSHENGVDQVAASQSDEEMLLDERSDCSQDEILLFDAEDEMLVTESPHCAEDDEMLLSQTTSIVPSLTSQSSTISTVPSTTTLRRPAPDELFELDSFSTFPLLAAHKLTTVALQTLIAGPSKRKRDLDGIRIRKPEPSIPVSFLIPSLFCPSFRGLMAHNSKYLRTVSNAICISAQNVQGVGLRTKLLALSNARVSEYSEGQGKEGSLERLISVVEGRIWRMMQRSSYEKGAAGKLWSKHDLGAESMQIIEDDDDLLAENGGDEYTGIGDAEEADFDEYIGEEFMNDYQELLFDDLHMEENNINLLNYFKEQERLAETDEMLFGGRSSEAEEADEEEDMLLLSDNNDNETMLL